MDALARRGFCDLPDAVSSDQLNDFETAVDRIGRAECGKLGIDAGDLEPIAAALHHDPEYRVFLFTKLKQLRCLSDMTNGLMERLAVSGGVLDHLGIREPGIHQTLKGDLPGDRSFDLPWHQDHVLNRSHRSCRIWVALRDVGETKGSLAFAVGSHGVQFDYVPDASGYMQVREDDITDAFDTEVIEARAGQGVIFNPFVVHRTVPNRGAAVRFSLILHIDDLTALYGPGEIVSCIPPFLG